MVPRDIIYIQLVKTNRIPEQHGGYFMNTLRDIRPGHSATVIKVHGEGALRRRLMDMGITRGVSVYVRKVAPFGDPIELNLRGYALSLRKADAAAIEVCND